MLVAQMHLLNLEVLGRGLDLAMSVIVFEQAALLIR